MATIKMLRKGDNPLSADVHPDEVENYRAGGFEIAGEKAPEPAADPFDHDGDGHPGGSLPDADEPKSAPAPRAAPKRRAKKKGK